jgi:hypothetical protein
MLSVAGAIARLELEARFLGAAASTTFSGNQRVITADIAVVAKIRTVRKIKTVPIPKSMRSKPRSIIELSMILVLN